MNKDRVKTAIEVLLAEIGEDAERDGLVRTPERVAKSLEFLTSGYSQDIEAVLSGALLQVHIALETQKPLETLS